MVDRDVVTEKVSTIERCLARIDAARGAAGLSPIDVDDVTALNLQRAIQAALDLAAHAVSTEGFGVPATSADAFRLLAERGLVGRDLAERLARMVGFRNISIHEYRKVDPEIVESIVAHRLGDLRELAASLLREFGLAAEGSDVFTGLIVEAGRIVRDPEPSGSGGVRLEIDLSAALAERLPVGASLAVSGVCLTVVAIEPEGERARAAVELSPETLARTRLAELRAGSVVNLEPALRFGDPLGGHWVQGHVDATSAVVERRDREDFRDLAFALPAALAPYLVEKGSVAVDGVSLTVSALAPDRFEVALVPHTLAVTTLGRLTPGELVNLEADVLAKYVERVLAERGLVLDPAEATT